MKTTYSRQELEKSVETSVSFAETLRKLGLNIHGSAYKTLKKYINLYDIDTSHFLGCGHLKGKSRNIKPKIPLEKILVKNSTYYNTTLLKKRLLNAGILKRQCYICGINEWCGKPLSLQLDHINGVHNDHTIENLRLLCPNCHSQTVNFAGRNIKRKATLKKKRRKKKDKNTQKVCADCSKHISRQAMRCKSCAVKIQNKHKIIWPTISDLSAMVKNGSYSGVARSLGVSDNAVRKRIKSELERTSKSKYRS